MVVVIEVFVPCIYVERNGRNMAYFITDECVACGACESECPESCITAGDDIYVIDENECTDCGTCAESCPTEAIQQR